MRRPSDEPQWAARDRLPRLHRGLHVGAHRRGVSRRLHAGGLPVLAGPRILPALVQSNRALPEFVGAFWRSLWLGALSPARALLVAVPAALAIARYRFRGRDVLAGLFLSPLMIPHVVLGVAFLRFFTQIGLGGRFAGLLLAHLVIVCPFALRLTLASAAGMDRAIEQA